MLRVAKGNPPFKGGHKMRKRLNIIGLMVLLAAFVLAGCSNENDPVAVEEQQAPNLPSVETMKLDIAFFESAGLPPQAVETGKLDGPLAVTADGMHLNYLNAAVRVLYLDVVVFSALVEPVVAFQLAVRSVPQPQGDGSWLWTYIVVEGAKEYAIYLYGKDEGTYSSWRLEVSTNDPDMPLDHFTWFAGEVESDNSGGYWQFYEPEKEPVSIASAALATPGAESIRIDWTENGMDGNSLILLVNKAGDPAEGSMLTFEEVPEHCSVEFYDAGSGDTGTILWRFDGSGYIEWPDFRNGTRSCWDNAQRDVDCIG
jgi:hypothetical protein